MSPANWVLKGVATNNHLEMATAATANHHKLIGQ
jgi:hypothetical protein